jgi:hypothetical protein
VVAKLSPWLRPCSFPKENKMSDERPITPEQALLAVKAAGLDPGRSLTEQLSGKPDSDLEQRVADLADQVRALSEAQAPPPDLDTRQHQFAEDFRDALNRNLTPWFGGR